MRVAVYGGSFNPPHVAHLMVAAWVRWTDQADEVWLVPSFAHPFAKTAQPFAVRRRWCEIATAELEGVRVCGIEAEIPAPSYSVDVLDALAERYPEHTFRFLLGADLLDSVARWKDWSRLEANYRPIVVGRQGYPDPEGSMVSFPSISSTDIRLRAAAQKSVVHLVPAAVAAEVADVFSSPSLDRCPGLSEVVGVSHGFTDRAGGVDWARCVPALRPDLTSSSVAWMTQVHGREVVRVTAPTGPDQSVGQADAAFTTEPDVVLAVRTADCVPVLVAGPGVVGVAHAGWRGVVAEVVPALLEAIERDTGVGPSELTAGIGPAISGAAYEVGAEVVHALEGAGIPAEAYLVPHEGERPHVDLRAAVRFQLTSRGVRRVDAVPRCTATDPGLYSYRANGPETGRQSGLIARRAS